MRQVRGIGRNRLIAMREFAPSVRLSFYIGGLFSRLTLYAGGLFDGNPRLTENGA
jgi:hypothetical protein